MSDIYWGLILIAIVSGASWCTGAAIGRRVSKRTGAGIILAVLITSGLYTVYLRDSILLAKILPFSNLIVVGNWLPLAAASSVGRNSVRW